MFVLVKQVFKDMEFLGWYTTGGLPDQSDIHIHKQVGGAGVCFYEYVNQYNSCCVPMKKA